MQHASRIGLVAAGFVLLLAGEAWAQTGGQASPGATVPKPGAADAAAKAKAGGEEPAPPAAKIEGNFGQWALICNEPQTKEEEPACSLVQALVERDSKQLMFRVSLTYGPKGNLVLRIDSPTGVALQKGLEFSPDEVKVYRLPF